MVFAPLPPPTPARADGSSDKRRQTGTRTAVYGTSATLSWSHFPASRVPQISAAFKFTKCKERFLCGDAAFLFLPNSFCLFSFLFFLSLSLFYFLSFRSSCLALFILCLCTFLVINLLSLCFLIQINTLKWHYTPCYFVYKIAGYTLPNKCISLHLLSSFIFIFIYYFRPIM